MAYKLVVESVRQPVLVVADDSIRPDDLQALRDVGVDGLIVAAGAGGGAGRPTGDAIGEGQDHPPGRAVRRRRGAAAARRRAGAGSADEDDEDDD